MDISAPAILLADRPRWAKCVTSVRRRREDRTAISSRSLADLGRVKFSPDTVRILLFARSSGVLIGHVSLDLEAASVCQDAPGDPSQLVGEGDGENVVMQTPSRCLYPGLEAVAFPAVRPD